MLDQQLIRKQVVLAAGPGPLAESAVRTIVAEAERYAREQAPAGEGIRALGLPGIIMEAANCAGETLSCIAEARGYLKTALEAVRK